MGEIRESGTPRRWLVLIAYMAATMACEIQWLAHASVARAAEAFYAGQFDPASLLNIDFLALLYMAVYLVLSIPASRLIDSRGLRAGIGFGSALLAAGSVVKALGARSYAVQVAAQLILAAAQPFLINAATALSARWFPLKERGLATGLASLAQYLGFVVALGITPLLVSVNPAALDYGAGMDKALVVYAVLAVAAAAAALFLVGDGPGWLPAAAETAGEAGADPGRKRNYRIAAVFASRDMKLTLLLFLIGLGIMNALTSMTDAVAGSIGAKDSDGLIGVFMILGGVVGAVLIPALSDRARARKPFIVLCAALMVPGAVGLAGIGALNPYRYSWSLVSQPDGATVEIRDRIPHPTFRSGIDGRYEFAFVLSRGGKKLEERTLAVEVEPRALGSGTADWVVAPDQPLLMDGTKTDDRTIGWIYAGALAAALVFGFAIMAAGPLGFQYAAEVSAPAPEAISQGTLLLAGQLSGIAFTAGMSLGNNEFLGAFLVLFAGLSALMLVLALSLGESPLIVTEEEKYAPGGSTS